MSIRLPPVDKSSTLLTVLLAIVCFGETYHLFLKLFAAALLGLGIFLMIEREKANTGKQKENQWIVFALGSAIFAALTSILAKVGIADVESNLGTAIRTSVVLLLAWGIVWMKGKQAELRRIDCRELFFIVLSGVATGASWLCYYDAIQNGIVSIVVPIDKMSILVTCAFSYCFLKEKMKRRSLLGLFLMLLGTLIMAIWC